MRTIIVAWMLAMLMGCVSPYPIPGTTDQFLVTKHSEIRSPFGTNGGFDFLEKCNGPDRPVMFYLEADFVDCTFVMADELKYAVVEHKSSQGQGGQIVSGLMNAAALGGVAAAAGHAGNAVSSSSSTVINQTRQHYRW